MSKRETKETLTGVLGAELGAHAKVLGGFVGLLWLLQLVNALLGGALTAFGVHPRTLFGLIGILFAPLLHVSFSHLIANTLPIAILGWFVMLRRKRDLLYVSALSTFVGGIGTWLIAPSNTVHVGASILVFGYLGYLLFRGIFERRIGSILGSLVVFFLYGGALFGVLPGQAGVSWQGHLFGLLGGILAARVLREPPEDSKPKALGVRVSSAINPGTERKVLQTKASDRVEQDVEAELERLRKRK